MMIFNRQRRLALIAGLAISAAAQPIFAEDEARLQEGQDAYTRGDLIGAVEIYTPLAEAGSAEAQTRLGWILDQAEDDEEAVRWYRAAADRQYAPGESGLAEMYAKGEGVDADPAKAVELFERAADNDHVPAIRILIDAYEKGHMGLQRDGDRASYWRQRLATAKSETESESE